MRQHDPPEPLVRSYAVTHPTAHVVLPQPEGWHQLLVAETGVMTVRTDGGSWLVPPHRGVWAPSGTQHELRTEGRVRVRSLYLTAGIVTDPGRCRAVEIPPFTRALVLHAVSAAPLWAHVERHAHLVAVLADQLVELADAPLHLPMPSDPRALEVAHLLLDDPACADDVGTLAAGVSSSRRTLERLFLAETGMSVGRWRTQVRIQAAVRRLVEGASVTRVAADVGYATPSAFAAAFRQVLGTSPSRYLGAGIARAGR
jgi:AraC-like DNA-binding protein